MMYIDEAEIVSVNKPYEDGKKSKKLMVEHHLNCKGITLKKLIPLVIILLASFLSLLITDFWLAMILLISLYFLSIPLAFYDFKKS